MGKGLIEITVFNRDSSQLNGYQQQCKDFVEAELDTRILSEVLLSKADNPERFAYFKAFPFTLTAGEITVKDDGISFTGTKKQIKAAGQELDSFLEDIIAHNIAVKSFLPIRKLGILGRALSAVQVGCFPDRNVKEGGLGNRSQAFTLFGTLDDCCLVESELRELVKKVEGNPISVLLKEDLDKDDCLKITKQFGDSVEFRVEQPKILLYSLDMELL